MFEYCIQTESKASITTGLQLSIPNNAIYYHSFNDSSQDQMAYWTPKLTPLKPDIEISSSASATFAGEVRVESSQEAIFKCVFV